MKKLIRLLFCAAALAFGSAPAHAQSQPELEALLAPVALYPDPVLSQILMAASFPDQVAEAAQWSRAYPQLNGEAALRAVDPYSWDASVKALVAYPDLLARMGESPQWTFDLGNAFLTQQPQVMAAVQVLRQRAYASGYLRNNEQQYVQQQGPDILVQPAAPQVVYVPYYDPLVVYGPWWVPYRPVYWRPWYARPAFVSVGFFYSSFDWRQRYVRIVHAPSFVRVAHAQFVPGRWQRPAFSRPQWHAPISRPFVRVPESQRQPIIQSAPPRTTWRSEPQTRPLARVPESQRQPIVQSAPPRTNWRSESRLQARPFAQGAPQISWRPAVARAPETMQRAPAAHFREAARINGRGRLHKS
jgi:Protein of unknown function (DUF3300)